MSDYVSDYQAKEGARQEWLKTLKAGDVVACSWFGRGTERQHERRTVKRVTPTGRIRLDDDSQFDARGRRNQGGTWGYSVELEPWTEDIEKLLARRKLVGSVLYYLDRSTTDSEKVEAMSDEDLVSMRNLLRTVRLDDIR